MKNWKLWIQLSISACFQKNFKNEEFSWKSDFHVIKSCHVVALTVFEPNSNKNRDIKTKANKKTQSSHNHLKQMNAEISY